ncbi:flagellar export protein FliJ [Caldisalinibacter kiritimatiensis]|uniref:Flagellar FliJ protein n=1 Tax=Caldisalinibacter kiritimatiensis TaxID=1304284 RepID=R1CKQ3_9FIRM|nr:flagellar export protein FliJ [Caldisalinibacter kiritimatiensis]EOC99305.1 Flagellar protein FliJ [Caldisalinibacter kiritimatiensis]
MKKYKFKLQKILDYKEGVENKKKSLYGKLKKELEEEEKKLNQVVMRKKKLLAERNDALEGTTIKDLKAYSLYINSINDEIHQQKNIINRKREECEGAKKELIDITKERKMFEKLKEKDYKEYTYLVKKEEEKLIDQLTCFSNYIK